MAKQDMVELGFDKEHEGKYREENLKINDEASS